MYYVCVCVLSPTMVLPYNFYSLEISSTDKRVICEARCVVALFPLAFNVPPPTLEFSLLPFFSLNFCAYGREGRFFYRDPLLPSSPFRINWDVSLSSPCSLPLLLFQSIYRKVIPRAIFASYICAGAILLFFLRLRHSRAFDFYIVLYIKERALLLSFEREPIVFERQCLPSSILFLFYQEQKGEKK